jgi:hypothetical protein
MRNHGVVFTGIVAAGVLAGCADDPPPPMTTHGTAAELGGVLRDAMARHESATVDLDLGASGRGTCVVRTSGEPATRCEMAGTESSGGAAVDYTMLSGLVYVKVPQGLGDRPWVELAPIEDANPLAQAMADVGAHVRDSADVRVALTDDAIITDRGEETVGGTRTVRYTLSVPVVAGSGDRNLDQLAEQGVTSRTIGVWVGGDDLPVRSEVVTTVPGTSPVSVVATYRGWGGPVEITPPPAEQRGELPAVAPG